MGKKRKKSLNLPSSRRQQRSTVDNCFHGEILDRLMHELCKGIETAKKSKGGLSEKIWIKQQFSIGVNDVTRLLERMPRSGNNGHPPQSIQLQAILVAVDCSPKLLTKHIPVMAASRRVPVICIKDDKGGSFRLGALVKLKTSLSIGIKAKGTKINQVIDKFLNDKEFKDQRVESQSVYPYRSVIMVEQALTTMEKSMYVRDQSFGTESVENKDRFFGISIGEGGYDTCPRHGVVIYCIGEYFHFVEHMAFKVWSGEPYILNPYRTEVEL